MIIYGFSLLYLRYMIQENIECAIFLSRGVFCIYLSNPFASFVNLHFSWHWSRWIITKLFINGFTHILDYLTYACSRKKNSSAPFSRPGLYVPQILSLAWSKCRLRVLKRKIWYPSRSCSPTINVTLVTATVLNYRRITRRGTQREARSKCLLWSSKPTPNNTSDHDKNVPSPASSVNGERVDRVRQARLPRVIAREGAGAAIPSRWKAGRSSAKLQKPSPLSWVTGRFRRPLVL